MSNQEAINSLYRQRDRFIIIGLTGRTGAGCTTVSKILSCDSIQKLDLKSYKTCDFLCADERKYSVVYRFMKEGNRWKPFIVIEASSVIFSYILEKSFSALWKFVEDLSSEGRIYGLETLKKNLKAFFDADNKEDTQLAEIFLNDDEKQAFESVINKNAYDQKHNMFIIENGIELFDTILKQKKNQFREILKDFIIEKDRVKIGRAHV